MTGGRRTRPRSRATAGADAAALESPPGVTDRALPAGDDHAGRPIALRLARLHLRMGSLPLARAELESLAGRAKLDEEALLDLAEVRWRTGDLAGAGEAANALLERGREDRLALVIAAEAVSAQGRPGEARRIAGRAVEAAAGPLDPLFAGMPRSPIWPAEDVGGDVPAAAPGATVASRHSPVSGARAAAGAAADADTPAPTGAAEAYAGGRAALGAGDTTQAAVRLGVALRLEPGYAHDVLEAIGERAEVEPALALVAGDALRLLGRESEARLAYDAARGHAPSPADDVRGSDDDGDEPD